MEDDDPEPISASKFQPPNFVTLSPFSPTVSPSPRRLSSCFLEPNRPIRAGRQLAWVSLQGRLIGAEEASSAKSITRGNGSVLSPEEAISWELFTPIHRILIVAVIAVASANCQRNKEIIRLKKAVELRDQVLTRMQEKLDILCEQISYFKDQPEPASENYGCQFCLKHKYRPCSLEDNAVKTSKGDELLKYKLLPTCEAEPEERRMSDLSDWAPSIQSSVDYQMNSSVLDQDIYNLRRECEEKDSTIKELSTFIRSSEVLGSKRIGELEDLIRRKNTIITKLKKDMMVLEQKVVYLTRSRRPSFSTSISNERQLPAMVDNLLYYMDSSTSPSSSDSDTPSRNEPDPTAISQQVLKIQGCAQEARKIGQARNSDHLTNNTQKFQTPSPLKEKSLNLTTNVDSGSRREMTSSFSHSRSRRRAPARPRSASTQKRWV
ncbi:OLC1v1005784C1 [Oldenlandia corymbosa var. corymbosa]|uniref:OLC1v1005784C1 n=1 Tax=Oldenlandia corymbosa var. corymbosa TaxID=529605 RepID=A0AAV1DID0_OLDCO|nr:OLC1v1005784C1 [Oldenlandia corymbosa var. corymbosa]